MKQKGSWKWRGLMPLMLGLLLTGCAGKSSDCELAAQPPATPSLPSSARQETQLSICSPSCSKALTAERANWQRRLTEVE